MIPAGARVLDAMRVIASLSVAVMAASAHAAKPSADVVDACLQGESRGHPTWTAIATDEVGLDDDFRGGTRRPSSGHTDEMWATPRRVTEMG